MIVELVERPDRFSNAYLVDEGITPTHVLRTHGHAGGSQAERG